MPALCIPHGALRIVQELHDLNSSAVVPARGAELKGDAGRETNAVRRVPCPRHDVLLILWTEGGHVRDKRLEKMGARDTSNFSDNGTAGKEREEG